MKNKNKLKSDVRAHAAKYVNLSIGTVFDIVADLIKLAETYGRSSGEEKRAAVLEAISLIIHELKPSKERDELIELLKGPIPRFIDAAVSLAKSKAFLGVWRSIRALFEKCRPCCREKCCECCCAC